MNRIWLAFFVFTLTVFCAVTIVKNADKSGSLRQIGAWDFLSFYAGAEVLREGGNPYSQAAVEEKMLRLERPEGYFHGALRNPPWIFAVMAPVFAVEFGAANNLWVALNCAFALFGASTIWMLFAKRESLIGPAAAAFLFVPTMELIVWGNIALLCAFGLALFFWAVDRKIDLLAGALLLIPLLKPHLFLIWGVVLIYWILRNRRFGIFAGFLLSASCLTFTVECMRPGTSLNFAKSLFTSSEHSGQYINATLGDAFELALRPVFGERIDMLPDIITIAAIILSVCFLAVRRPQLSLLDVSPALLCLSLLVAPYGWFHDHSILVLVQAAVLAKASAGKQGVPLAAAALLLQAITAAAKIPLHAQHQFFWFPLAMLGLVCLAQRLLRRQQLAVNR